MSSETENLEIKNERNCDLLTIVLYVLKLKEDDKRCDVQWVAGTFEWTTCNAEAWQMKKQSALNASI